MPDLDTRFRSFGRVRAPELWPEIERREPSPALGPPLRPRIVAGVVACLVAAAGFAFAERALSGGRESSPRPGSPRTVGASQAVQGEAVLGASTPGALWVTTCTNCPPNLPAKQGELVHIDPSSGRVIDSSAIDSPGDVAASGDAAWVLDFLGGSISRVDAGADQVTSTTQLTLPPGRQMADGSFLPENVAVGEGAVWVGTARGALVKVDPHTNSVEDTTALPPETTGDIAAGAGGVWVAEGLLGLYRIDPQTGTVVDKIRITRGQDVLSPSEVAVIGGDVVVSGGWSKPITDETGVRDYQSTGDNAIVQIAPASDSVGSMTDVGYTRFVEGDDGHLWIDTQHSAVRVSLSPIGLDASTRVALPAPLLGVAGGRLWFQDSSKAIVSIAEHQ
ncbi:MAG: hypothetical protein M3O88_01950 [Actinomycetota bacterium]|nr:hypothetical protein [Actinomycetota bacterium]